VDDLIGRHRRACDGFARVAHAVAPDAWAAPTPCTEWDARDLVEHVIGFHDFLLLRPLGVRAERPRDDPAARWDATANALFTALEHDGVLDCATELPGGGQSSPRRMLRALTTEVLVHSWDLAVATRGPPELDGDLVEDAFAAATIAGMKRGAGMIGPEVAVGADTSPLDKLVAFYGRSPSWSA
jgi:uncharacterized protein (TIGR03086 family)